MSNSRQGRIADAQLTLRNTAKRFVNVSFLSMGFVTSDLASHSQLGKSFPGGELIFNVRLTKPHWIQTMVEVARRAGQVLLLLLSGILLQSKN